MASVHRATAWFALSVDGELCEGEQSRERGWQYGGITTCPLCAMVW